MAISELLQAFERDADDELRAIRASAEADARRIDAEAARDRAERILGAAAATAVEHRARADREVAGALHRARAEVLATRAAMLARLRAAVEAQIARAVQGQRALAEALVGTAVECAGDEPGTLRCTPAVADLARAGAPSSLRVEPDPAIPAGVVVELASGTRIDATLTTLLAREWPALACEALRIIEQETP